MTTRAERYWAIVDKRTGKLQMREYGLGFDSPFLYGMKAQAKDMCGEHGRVVQVEVRITSEGRAQK